MITFGNPVENKAIATRTVKFIDSYNDKTLANKTVELGKAVAAPVVPKHKGWVFINWYIDGTDTVADLSKILKNLIVETKYAEDKNDNGIDDKIDKYYTVRFIDGLDDSVLKTQKVLVGLDATSPIAITHEGYTFTAWDKAFENVKTNLTVTSLYDINSYDLTINYKYMKDYTNVAPLYSNSYNYNAAYNVTSPVIAGYTADKTVVNGIMPASDKTVDVLYTANKDTAYKVEHYTENLDGTYTLADTNNLTGTTDTLTNAVANNYTGFTVKVFDQLNIAGDGSTIVKIYYERNIYTLTYIVDGEEYQVFNIKYDDVINPIDSLTKKGYTFNGWSAIPAKMPANDVTINGTFKINKYFLTIFYINEHGFPMGFPFIRLYDYNYTYDVVSKVIPGYTADKPVVSGTIPDENSFITVKYTANKNTPYTVEYYKNGVLQANDTVIRTGTTDTFVSVTNADKNKYIGYTFTLSGSNIFDIIRGDGGTVLKVNYKINHYELDYRANAPYGIVGISQTPNDRTYTILDEFNITALMTSTSHNFLGWYTNPNGTGTPVTKITEGTTEDTTLYAKWAIKKFTVTFNKGAHGNISYTNTSDVSYNTSFSSIAKPVVTADPGYTFKDWGLAGSTKITSNITVTASYTPNRNTAYKVKHYTENLNGGYTLVGTDNRTGITDTLTSAAARTLTGFTVQSFSQKNINGDGSTIVEIRYTRNIYKLTFRPENGGVDIVAFLKYEQAIVTPPVSKTGYTFNAWTPNVASIMPANNVTYTATWTINSYNLTINYKYTDGTEARTSYSNSYNYNSHYSVNSPLIPGYTANTLTVNGIMPASNRTVEVTYTANNDTAYKVEHYTENLNGGYTLVGTDNKTGTTDTLTNGIAKTLSGFTVQSFNQLNISGNGSTVVKIYYTRDTYKLTYMVDDVKHDEQSLKYEASITPLTYPTKTGYTFSGWSTIPTIMPASDVTINGSFNIVTYNVTYNLNQTGVTGALESNILVTYNVNTPLYSITSATSLSHSFDGWYTDPINGTEVTTLAGGEIGDVTLYAHWTANKYTVSFNSNGGSSVTPIDNILYNETITKPSDPTKLGFDFENWYKENTLTNKWDFTTDTVKASLTLYANWTETVYNLTYNINSTNVTSASNPSNPSTYTISSEFTFAKASSASHDFLGWYTDSVNGTNLLGITLGSTGNKALYAHWSIKNYTLTFVDTNNNVITKNVNWGSDLDDVPTITPVTGYSCSWDRTDFTNITSDDTINPDCDLITYNVTYNLNQTGVTGATHSNILNSYNVNTLAYTLLDGTSLSHSFDGWYTDPVTGNKVTTLAGGTIGDVTLYAHWTANKYTVDFNSNGGSSVLPINDVLYNETITKPSDPTKLGFGFADWYKENTLTNKWNFTTDTVKASLTLYANWTKEIYNLVFNINDAGVINPVNPSNASTYTISDNLTFNNASSKSHNFDGWYTLPASGSKVTGITAGTITGNQTYYAHWSIKSFTLTVDANGGTWSGTTPQTINYGSFVTINNPAKDGYNFNGWTKTGADSTISDTTFTMGSENATLTANWTPRTDLDYTIYYRLQDTTTNIQTPTLVSGKTFGETYTETAPNIIGYEKLDTTKNVTVGTGTNEVIFYYKAVANINVTMTSTATSGSSTVSYGDFITYTLTATNTGTGDGIFLAKDLVLLSETDMELIDTGLTTEEIAARGALLSNTGLSKTITSGSTYTLVFKVKVTGNAGSSISNQLTYEVGGISQPSGTIKTYNIEKTISVKAISEEGIDIVLALDISGSMNGSKLTSMKNAAKAFIDVIFPGGNVTGGTEICLVTFPKNSAGGATLRGCTDGSSNPEKTPAELKTLIDGLSTNNSTPYTDAFNLINTTLSSMSSTNPNTIVFLSDGEPNTGGNGYVTTANTLKANGTTIYTIGFEVTTSAATTLRNLATSSSYYYTGTVANIESVFSNIATEISTTSKTSVNGIAEIGNDIDTTKTIEFKVNGTANSITTVNDAVTSGYLINNSGVYSIDLTKFNAGDTIIFTYYKN